MAAADTMLPSSTSSVMFWVLPVVMGASTGFTCWEYPQVLPVVMGVSTGFTCCDWSVHMFYLLQWEYPLALPVVVENPQVLPAFF